MFLFPVRAWSFTPEKNCKVIGKINNSLFLFERFYPTIFFSLSEFRSTAATCTFLQALYFQFIQGRTDGFPVFWCAQWLSFTALVQFSVFVHSRNQQAAAHWPFCSVGTTCCLQKPPSQLSATRCTPYLVYAIDSLLIPPLASAEEEHCNY